MPEIERERDLSLLSDANAMSLFWPYTSDRMREAVANQLQTRWLGQGPQVDEFETRFAESVLSGDASAVAVSSGTAALHLSYLMATGGYEPGARLDGEVIAPVFTCTATNLPFLYMGLQIRWGDIDPETMNLSVESVEALIGPKTRAISVVHYGGYPAEVLRIRKIADRHGVPVIEDAAQALGATIDGQAIGTVGDFTAFSFQAIKHITTGDGGLVAVRNPEQVELARRLRWFGIDRAGKQQGIWENDVSELGYKYQMTDIAASMGLAGLADLDSILDRRRSLLKRYEENLDGEERVRLLVPRGRDADRMNHAAWLATVVVPEGRDRLREALREQLIESNAVHFRNDMYSVFEGYASGECPNMDSLDGRYLCLPLHTELTPDDVDRVCETVTSDW